MSVSGKKLSQSFQEKKQTVKNIQLPLKMLVKRINW